jgi:phosphoribosyl 1,2-cyclic phosphate phosphodiesterase
MQIRFLGTGSAWCVPEHSCSCQICAEMTRLGEERTRTSFVVQGRENILVDCGPDIRSQMRRHRLGRPDAILITHEHGDHFLGLDDLLPFRRSLPREAWQPIPVYATAQAWEAIRVRFGYLLGSLIEPREAVPGVPVDGLETNITPFKTFHGPTAPGSVGYSLEDGSVADPFKLVYTSDFIRLDDEPDFLFEPDVLVIQSHWLNEPANNRPHHMSFQRAIEYVRRWRPKRATYLVHLSAGDQVRGDPCNNSVKKPAPKSPLTEPETGKPYPVPRCQTEWQDLVNRICKDLEVPQPVIVADDGMAASF